MSTINLIHGSCADQTADAVVNAAHSGLWAGGGICGVIFNKCGISELTAACKNRTWSLMRISTKHKNCIKLFFRSSESASSVIIKLFSTK